MKPCSEACERNRGPILDALARIFSDRRRVLEIGSGTGQHAAYFGTNLPHLIWQTTDLPACHAAIRSWLEDDATPNVRLPIALDVVEGDWAVEPFDALFSANVVHIISWTAVEAMFRGIGRYRDDDCILALYGPFNYGGRFTSESNARFDAWLRRQDASSGIRDFEAVDALARGIGLALCEDDPMPANNRLLVWRRR